MDLQSPLVYLHRLTFRLAVFVATLAGRGVSKPGCIFIVPRVWPNLGHISARANVLDRVQIGRVGLLADLGLGEPTRRNSRRFQNFPLAFALVFVAIGTLDRRSAH